MKSFIIRSHQLVIYDVVEELTGFFHVYLYLHKYRKTNRKMKMTAFYLFFTLYALSNRGKIKKKIK